MRYWWRKDLIHKCLTPHNLPLELRLLLVLALALGLLSCRTFARSEPKYGPEHNAVREQVGLPIIPADWEAELVHSGECTWVNPERIEKRDARVPVHWSKYLNYHTGELLYEVDTYFGREDYTAEEEGTFREKLRIAYYYQVDDYDYKERLGWDVTLHNQEYPFGETICLEEAETILNTWGISRK